jgi:hypothetical protein
MTTQELVERLRSNCTLNDEADAADRLEALDAENKRLKSEVEFLHSRRGQLVIERDKAREARFADDDDGYDMPVTDYDRDLARAALSALPERELLAEALDALTPFYRAAQMAEWNTYNRGDDPAPDSHMSVPSLALTIGQFRRARAAADKIRAALTQEKQP